jgi:hypothetical protein
MKSGISAEMFARKNQNTEISVGIWSKSGIYSGTSTVNGDLRKGRLSTGVLSGVRA